MVAAVAPPTETHVLDLLADGFPVLRGGIGPLPVDLLGPVMVDLSRDIAEISGYHAATRVGEAIAAGTIDAAALLPRSTSAIRTPSGRWRPTRTSWSICCGSWAIW